MKYMKKINYFDSVLILITVDKSRVHLIVLHNVT